MIFKINISISLYLKVNKYNLINIIILNLYLYPKERVFNLDLYFINILKSKPLEDGKLLKLSFNIDKITFNPQFNAVII